MFFGNRERHPQPRILRTAPKRTSYTFKDEGETGFRPQMLMEYEKLESLKRKTAD